MCVSEASGSVLVSVAIVEPAAMFSLNCDELIARPLGASLISLTKRVKAFI